VRPLLVFGLPQGSDEPAEAHCRAKSSSFNSMRRTTGRNYEQVQWQTKARSPYVALDVQRRASSLSTSRIPPRAFRHARFASLPALGVRVPLRLTR
jgi:hypothetical protein